jgi:DNA-directed RNA polymerase omega subunit
MKKADYIPIEELLGASKGSVYKLTMLAAKRSLQIADGDKPLVESAGDDKPLDTALREIKEGKIRMKEGNKTEPQDGGNK